VKALNIALWVAQVLLGLAFLMAGVMKTTKPIADLAVNMTWVARVPPGEVRFIGAAELLGALGLLLPSLTRIMPKLTVLAALGLVVVMILAAAHHLMHGEAKMVPINVVLGGIALFIAWGRWQKAPITPRA
jgi:putative oxidoreductase